MRQVLVVLILVAGSFSFAYSQDSAVMYYIYPDALTHSAVNLSNIEYDRDPYITTDGKIIEGLIHVLEDSLAKTYVTKLKRSTVYELRIFIKFYQNNKLKKAYGITLGGREAIIDKEMYAIENIRSLLRFIKYNFTPVTDGQKINFVFPYRL